MCHSILRPYTSIPDTNEKILNGPVSTDVIRIALKKAKNNQSCGNDDLAIEFFKYNEGILEKPMCALFNHVLDTGQYPDLWTIGTITPIHKNANIAQPSNYRKITLLPALSKIFERILNNRLKYCRKIT